MRGAGTGRVSEQGAARRACRASRNSQAPKDIWGMSRVSHLQGIDSQYVTQGTSEYPLWVLMQRNVLPLCT